MSRTEEEKVINTRFSQPKLKFTCSKWNRICKDVLATNFKYSQSFYLCCWEKPSKSMDALVSHSQQRNFQRPTSQSTLLYSDLPHHPYRVRKAKAFQSSRFDRNTNLFLLSSYCNFHIMANSHLSQSLFNL